MIIGVITKAQEASFRQEMTAIREKINMKKAAELLDHNLENLSSTTFKEEVKMKDYVDGGKKKTITKDGKTYIAYDYENKIWVNVKTVNGGNIGYWTWIPRYAYAISGNQTQILSLDTRNNTC